MGFEVEGVPQGFVKESKRNSVHTPHPVQSQGSRVAIRKVYEAFMALRKFSGGGAGGR